MRKLIKFIYHYIKWSKKCKFFPSSKIGIKSKFEGMNQIHRNAEFSGYLGYGSYIGPYSSLRAKIGRFCSIGPFVRCNGGRHPYTYPWVSTAPCFYSLNETHAQNSSTFATEQIFEENLSKSGLYTIEIGNDVWIGEGAFIVGGIKIGDGAVILAHAVITHDVPPYAIMGGVPASIIKFRYSEEDIQFLLKMRWWDNSKDWFAKNWKLLSNFNELKEYYSGKRNSSVS